MKRPSGWLRCRAAKTPGWKGRSSRRRLCPALYGSPKLLVPVLFPSLAICEAADEKKRLDKLEMMRRQGLGEGEGRVKCLRSLSQEYLERPSGGRKTFKTAGRLEPECDTQHFGRA